MFKGSMVALITPFKNGKVDETALAGLVEFQIANGTDVICPCGTTGESATLSFEEHERVVEIVIRAAGGRALLSPIRLDSASPWLRHKTTVRDLYEQELARVQNDPAVLDVIFLNERNEICEGARSNVFVRMAAGGPLLTPPLACGLLPGVLRRQLLESGEAREQLLAEADLHSAAELYLGNALRGLIRVSLQE